MKKGQLISCGFIFSFNETEDGFVLERDDKKYLIPQNDIQDSFELGEYREFLVCGQLFYSPYYQDELIEDMHRKNLDTESLDSISSIEILSKYSLE